MFLKLNNLLCAMALKVIALVLLCGTMSRLGSVVADATHIETIRKCCPSSQLWDIQENRCEQLAPDEATTELLENQIPGLESVSYKVVTGHQCPEGTDLQYLNPRNPLHDFSFHDFGLLLVEDTVFLPTDHFCLDRRDANHKLMVMACVNPNWSGLSSPAPPIPINKCCPEGQSYVPETDSNPHSGCSATSQKWRPPELPDTDKEIFPVLPDDWDVSHGIPTCATGEDLVTYYVPDGTNDHGRLILNSDASLPDRNLPVVHNPEKFCVDNTVSSNLTRTVVKLCFHNPCKNKTCIKRCCPEGFVMNLTSQECDFQAPESFRVEIKDAAGNLLPNRSESQIHNFYASMPGCHTGTNQLSPKDNTVDYFYLTETGNLYVPAYKGSDREISVYCVDYFGDDPTSLHVDALICFPEEKVDPDDVAAVIKIYPYFLFISSVFLLATFVVYAILPELQNLHGMTIMCHVFSLFVTYICLGVVQLRGSTITMCKPIAVVIHFFFLSAFTWMGTMGFDLFWTFRYGSGEDQQFWNEIISGRHSEVVPMEPLDELSISSSSFESIDDAKTPQRTSEPKGGMRVRRAGQERHVLRFLKYSLFAWGVPLVIVVVGQILDNLKNLPDWVVQPEFGKEKCWFSESNGQLGILCYFYGPIAVIIVCNLIFFVTTATRLNHANRDSNMATRNGRAKQRFRVVMSVSVLMGVTWIMEVVSWAVGGNAYYWMATDILNILQAVFIFVIFVCKRKVLQLMYRRYQPVVKAWRAVVPKCMACYCCDQYATRDTSTFRASSSAKRKISTTQTSQTHVHESSVERDPASSGVIMNDMHSKR